MKCFVKDIFSTVQAFGMQIGDNLLYCGIENQLFFCIFFSLYFFLFLCALHNAFFSKIAQQSFKVECSYLVHVSRGCNPAFSGLFFLYLLDFLSIH